MMLRDGRPQKPYRPCPQAEAHGVASSTLESFDLLRQIMELESEICDLKIWLTEAMIRCFYRRNMVCDPDCGARGFCKKDDISMKEAPDANP